MHWRSQLGMPCPLHADPPASVRSALLAALAGQGEAIQNVTDAVQAWWDDFSSEHHGPLVLLFTGSSGVGKSEAAFAVARGLLSSAVRTPDGGGKTIPEGLVEFRGEHFLEGNVTAQREALRLGIARALYQCAGRAVVVFDEVQKAHKPALTELVALMQGRNSRVAGMDASRLVIILTADSGVCFIDEVAGGTALARARFNERLRRKLNEEFEEAEVPLGSLASRIIPFQPLTWALVRDVAAHHLQYARLPASARALFDSLAVDNGALSVLASMAYVPYTSWRCGDGGQVREETTQCMEHHSAREEGPAGAAEAEVGADGRAAATAPQDPTALCGVPCSVPDSCSSEFGSRSVMHQAESPVKRLVRLLHRGAVGAWLRQHSKPEDLDVSVELRVQAACNLPGVRTPNLCTRLGAPGLGLRVLRCASGGAHGHENCTKVWEGALPE